MTPAPTPPPLNKPNISIKRIKKWELYYLKRNSRNIEKEQKE